MDESNNIITIPKICQWYLQDFSGATNKQLAAVEQILSYANPALKASAGKVIYNTTGNPPTIKYASYSWDFRMNLVKAPY